MQQTGGAVGSHANFADFVEQKTKELQTAEKIAGEVE